MPDSNYAKYINGLMAVSPIEERLKIIQHHSSNSIFTTSLGQEDQALLWYLVHAEIPVRFVTLNTERLFPETVSLISATRKKFDIDIDEYAPASDALEFYIDQYGENGFYDSLAARKACCGVRKVEPLGRALKDADGWITGLTREQSPGRSAVPFAEWDEQHSLIKYNPIADFSSDQISSVIAGNNVPTNVLHARGYPSIGCEPCTRAIKPGEHPRAGRWWWEQETSSECGLHVRTAQELDRSNNAER